MNECPHGYASKASCVECMLNGPTAAPPKPWRETPSTTSAQHEATCRGVTCGEPIAEGDRIRLWTRGDDDTAWLHDGCRM